VGTARDLRGSQVPAGVRFGGSTSTLNELDEDSAGAAGVKEGDLMTAGAGTGGRVDELDATFRQPRQIGAEVVGEIGDVVQGGSSSREEAPHRGFGPQGLEDLDRAAEGDAYALGFQGLRVGTYVTGEELEEPARVVDGGDRDSHVVEWAIAR